jgi:hypothetical protein
MKCKIIFKLLFVSLLFPSLSYAQELKPPGQLVKEDHYEKQDDPYLPNAYDNKKLLPAYRYNGRSYSRSGSTEIFTRQVNVSAGQLNIVGDAANEPNIAVNPLNENEIVIGWRQFNNVNSNFRQAGWAYSSDGGETWTFPGSLNPGVFQSDPVLDYDNEGNFYYNSLVSTISGDLPCFVYKSDDGGMTWDNGIYIGGGDKQWMTIDRSGGIGEANIYSAWTSAFSDCPPGFFTRSTNSAASFEDCSVIIDDLSWGTQTVGNNGELYVCGRSPATVAVRVAKSENAQDPKEAVEWSSLSTANLGGYITAGEDINPEGLTGQIYIDVDRSDGPGRDNVYVVASVKPYFNSDIADVMFNKSTDGAISWNNASPVRINDDPDTTNIQWFGTMSVAPNGRIDVIWLDTRDHPGSDSSALYYSYSLDQGNTWNANEKLSDSFDPHIGYPNQSKMGDYFDMISSNSGVHLSWVNTLNGEEDVYYSFITPAAITGNKEISGDFNISVFPNPTSGQLQVTCGDDKTRIEIYTTIGRRVYSTPLYGTKHSVDMSSLTAGIYFLKLISEDRHETIRKIIKQ